MEYEKINLPQTVAVAISKNLIELNQAEKDSSFLENNSTFSIPFCHFYLPKITSFVNKLQYFYNYPCLDYGYSHVKAKQHQAKLTADDFEHFEFDNTVPVKRVKIETVYGNNTLLSFEVMTTAGISVRANKTVSTASVCRTLLNTKTENKEYENEFHFLNRKNKLELVSKDSSTWKWYLKCSERQKTPSVPKQNLQVGKIYKNKTGRPAVFIGYVTTVNYQPIISEKLKKIIKNGSTKTNEKYDFDGKLTNVNLATMWLNLPSYYLKIALTEEKNSDALNSFVQRNLSTGIYSGVSILKKHNFIELVDEIPAYDITAATFSALRTNANEDLQRILIYNKKNNSNSLIRDVRTARIISKISKFVNLMPFGMEPEMNPYFNTWLKNKNKTNK